MLLTLSFLLISAIPINQQQQQSQLIKRGAEEGIGGAIFSSLLQFGFNIQPFWSLKDRLPDLL